MGLSTYILLPLTLPLPIAANSLIYIHEGADNHETNSYKIQPNIRGIGPGRAMKLYAPCCLNLQFQAQQTIGYNIYTWVSGTDNCLPQWNNSRLLRRRRRSIRVAILQRCTESEDGYLSGTPLPPHASFFPPPT